MKTYICECGKAFDKVHGMTGHQKNCQVHKDIVKQKKESRRLPNGMFKCENPDCGKEHDGSYGSGRFCSIECRRHYTSLMSYQTQKKNGTFKCNFNTDHIHYRKAEFGRWKCTICNQIFDTRSKLIAHRKTHGLSLGHAWNKGLTKETCLDIAKSCSKISASVKLAIAEGRCTGKGATPEKEALRKKRMSIAALNRTTPSVCKRTEPYIKKDGTIVNLDSSYERTIAKILDEHNIDWIRPKPLDWYSKDGVKHHYFPDFYLAQYDVYLDPKNDYCFKVQAEKILYVKEHYANCIFMTKDQLTWEYIKKILESQSSPVTTPHC